MWYTSSSVSISRHFDIVSLTFQDFFRYYICGKKSMNTKVKYSTANNRVIYFKHRIASNIFIYVYGGRTITIRMIRIASGDPGVLILFDTKRLDPEGITPPYKKHYGANRPRLENRHERNKKTPVSDEREREGGRDLCRFERRRMQLRLHRERYRERGARECTLASGSRMGNWNGFISRRKTRFFSAGETTDFSFDRAFLGYK